MPRHCSSRTVARHQQYYPTKQCRTTTQYPSNNRTTTPSPGKTINADKINFGGDNHYYAKPGETIVINTAKGQIPYKNPKYMSISRNREKNGNYSYSINTGGGHRKIASTDSPFSQQRKIQADQFKQSKETPKTTNQKSSIDATLKLIKDAAKKRIGQNHPLMLDEDIERQATNEVLEAITNQTNRTNNTNQRSKLFKVFK